MAAVRVGVFGGTFDPIHNGHLHVADHVRLAVKLERVVLVPSGDPYHRAGVGASSIDRLAMAALATIDRPWLTVSAVDVDRGGPTYTVDTLRDLKAMWGDAADLSFIMGADSLATFNTWRDPDEILSLATVLAVARPGVILPKVHDERIQIVSIPANPVTATHIRALVASGGDPSGLVPEAVAQYIRDHGLYGRS